MPTALPLLQTLTLYFADMFVEPDFELPTAFCAANDSIVRVNVIATAAARTTVLDMVPQHVSSLKAIILPKHDPTKASELRTMTAFSAPDPYMRNSRTFATAQSNPAINYSLVDYTDKLPKSFGYNRGLLPNYGSKGGVITLIP